MYNKTANTPQKEGKRTSGELFGESILFSGFPGEGVARLDNGLRKSFWIPFPLEEPKKKANWTIADQNKIFFLACGFRDSRRSICNSLASVIREKLAQIMEANEWNGRYTDGSVLSSLLTHELFFDFFIRQKLLLLSLRTINDSIILIAVHLLPLLD